MPRSFPAYGEGFLWTRRGLVMVNELKREESVFGVNSKGSYSWEAVSRSGKIKTGEFRRIITDQGESVIAKESWIFTTRGLMRARDLSAGVVTELVGIPKNFRESLEVTDRLTVCDSRGNDYEIDQGLAYVLGLQKRVRKLDKNKVRFLGFDEKHAIKIARCASDWLSQYRKHDHVRIGGNRVIVRSELMTELCRLYETVPPPLAVRCSPSLLASFLVGFFESSVWVNRYEDPPFYFQLPVSEQTRFIIIALRLFGIVPAKIHVLGVEEGAIVVNIFIKETDFDAVVKDNFDSVKGKIRNYSYVRNILGIRGDTFTVEIRSRDEHWSPIVDLMPIHALP